MSFPTYPSSSPELSKIGHRLVGEQNLTPQNVSSACGLLPTEKIKALKDLEWNFDFHLKCLKEFSSVPRKELSLENTAKILSRGGGETLSRTQRSEPTLCPISVWAQPTFIYQTFAFSLSRAFPSSFPNFQTTTPKIILCL